MSELNNVNDPHHDNDDDEDIPTTWHIFEVTVTETSVYHEGANIPSHIKGKDAIEAYMAEARKATDWDDNPYDRMFENIHDCFTKPVEWESTVNKVSFLHTFDPDAPN